MRPLPMAPDQELLPPVRNSPALDLSQVNSNFQLCDRKVAAWIEYI
jgi:hypothetical protein